jgi:hypothetical protein
MKKFLATFLMMAMMAIMIPFAAVTEANAQTRYYTRNGRVYTYQKRSFYQKHRDKINMGIGTVAGALLGGIIGGKKGAGIGALAGLGGGALYTYKIKPKNRTYYR